MTGCLSKASGQMWVCRPGLPRNPDTTWKHQRPQPPGGPRNFSVQKPQNLLVSFMHRLQRGEKGRGTSKQTKFQPFYSKQLFTMYKYCILAHMKIQLLRHPEMCSYTLQDHSQRECTICSRQSAFEKSDYYPPVLHPVSGKYLQHGEKGSAVPAW